MVEGHLQPHLEVMVSGNSGIAGPLHVGCGAEGHGRDDATKQFEGLNPFCSRDGFRFEPSELASSAVVAAVKLHRSQAQSLQLHGLCGRLATCPRCTRLYPAVAGAIGATSGNPAAPQRVRKRMQV